MTVYQIKTVSLHLPNIILIPPNFTLRWSHLVPLYSSDIMNDTEGGIE
jgi:hypothetical protein